MQRTTRIGRYHLTERIAFGGMAEIFRGFTFSREGHRYDVAIKQLLPRYLEDEQFMTMLTDEYKLASILRHVNIAEVYELVAFEDTVFIAMEYVDGKDLRSSIDKTQQAGIAFAFDDIAYVMSKALAGLHHAHDAVDAAGKSLGVVHRDFSPSNVMISYDGHVKICDFGIAKASLNRLQTKAGIIKGKVKYMSPEQAFGHKLDRRSDVFSAGSVLYELCTGVQPFIARNEVDLIFAVRDAEPTPCREINPHIPIDLAGIIEKSMSRSRSRRYQSALEFHDALLEFLRRNSPRYHRSQLSRLMKHLWEDEIDDELRSLEDFVLDLSSSEIDLGDNLLADALGPEARYEKFVPIPTTHDSASLPPIEMEPTIKTGPPQMAHLTQSDDE